MNTWRLTSAGFLLAAITILDARGAAAQSIVTSVTGGASLVHGIGYRDRAFHAGGGIEFGSGPVRLGGEFGVVHMPEVSTTFQTPYGHGSGTMPAVSVPALGFRASYYLVRFERNRLQPFVTGGMSFYPDTEPFATFDGGGGFDWWASRNIGLRVEAREQYGSFFAVRVGVVLR